MSEPAKLAGLCALAIALPLAAFIIDTKIAGCQYKRGEIVTHVLGYQGVVRRCSAVGLRVYTGRRSTFWPSSEIRNWKRK